MRVMAENAARRSGCSRGSRAIFRPSTLPCPVGSDRALDGAILTQPDARDPAMLAKLDASRAACSAAEALGRHARPRPAIPHDLGRRRRLPSRSSTRRALPFAFELRHLRTRGAGRRGDPRHARARRAADRRDGGLRRGARHARRRRATPALERVVRAARRDAADRGQPALGARRACGACCGRRRRERVAPRLRGGGAASPTRTSRTCDAIGRHGLR